MGSFQAQLSTYLCWEVCFSLGGIGWERTSGKTPHPNKPYSLDKRVFIGRFFCLNLLVIQASGIKYKLLFFKNNKNSST